MSMKALCHASCPSTTHPWLSPGAGVPANRGSCVVPSRPRKGPVEPLPPCILSLLPLPGLKHGLNPLSSAPGGPEAGGGSVGGGTCIGQLGWAPPAAHCSGGGQGGPFPSGVSPGASPFVSLFGLSCGWLPHIQTLHQPALPAGPPPPLPRPVPCPSPGLVLATLPLRCGWAGQGSLGPTSACGVLLSSVSPERAPVRCSGPSDWLLGWSWWRFFCVSPVRAPCSHAWSSATHVLVL